MPQKECEDLVLQAVTQVYPQYILRSQTIEVPYADCRDLMAHTSLIALQAIRRDGSSGGCCRMAIITKVSWSKTLKQTREDEKKLCVFMLTIHNQDGVERKLWLNNELPIKY